MGVTTKENQPAQLTPADRYNKKRERIKLANRRRILEAAMDVFADIGYDRARVRDIISASGLSPGTFYNHFRSKEEIFDELLEGFLRDLEADIDRTLEDIRGGMDLAGDIFHKLLKAFTRNHKVMKVAARNQAILRGLRSDSKVSRLFRKSEEIIEKGMGGGLLPKAPIQILNLMIFGTAFEIVAYLSDKPTYNIKRIAGDLSTFFIGGLEALSKKYEGEENIPELDEE